MDDSGFVRLLGLTADAVLATKYYTVATGAILAYDWILTFHDELKYVWYGKKGWVFILFLINRYCPFIFTIWVIVADLLLSYSQESCNKAAWLEMVQIWLGNAVAQIFLLLRVHALTMSSRPILYSLSAYILVHLGLGLATTLLPGNAGVFAVPVPNQAFHFCGLATNHTMQLAYVIMALAYDIIVFCITVFASLGWFRRRSQRDGSSLWSKLIHGGATYFGIVCSSTFAWLMCILLAGEAYKFIQAQANSVLVSVVMNRLFFSLRAEGARWGRDPNDVFELSLFDESVEFRQSEDDARRSIERNREDGDGLEQEV